MLRRVITPSAVVNCAAVRTNVTLTKNSPVLHAVALENNYKNPMWISETAIRFRGLKDISKLKDDHPTVLSSLKRMEIYNMTQVSQVPQDFIKNPSKPTSVATNKPYADKNAANMSAISIREGFSNWWITYQEVKKRGLSLNKNSKPLVYFMKHDLKFWNVDQFVESKKVASVPFNGGTCIPYLEGSTFETLSSHMKANDHSYGIYFSEQQIESFGGEVNPGATGVAISANYGRLFNIEEFVEAESILRSLNRPSVDTATYLLSGIKLGEESAKRASDSNFKSKMWVSSSDAKFRGWQTVEGAKGIKFSNVNITKPYFHANDVNDIVLRKIGQYKSFSLIS